VRFPSVLSVRRACSVRVRTICERGVCIHLLEVSSDATLGAATARFVSPYPPGDAATRLIQPVLLARGALLLLERLSCDAGSSQLPEVLISNDWVASLCAPYARHTAWAGSAAPAVSALGQKCLFVHLIHNLESGYDGRLPLPPGGPLATLAALHQLPSGLVHEERAGVEQQLTGKNATSVAVDSVQLTRAALLCCNGWGTVSSSYRAELLALSSYAPLFRSFGSAAIACESGLPLRRRRAELVAHGNHAEAKAQLQRRYFGEGGVRSAACLLVFLGRIVYQKGVHLLLDVVPSLLRENDNRVQLLVCGYADPSDTYAERCAAQMAKLRATYPHNFWARPDVYFVDGPLASVAADFGLVPSLYEPSGLVREEFFTAGTPLVCASVGGLKERVRPYERAVRVGEGVLYEAHTHSALLGALHEAVALHAEDEHYAALRRNAYAAACDSADTAWHWRCELSRLLACHCSALTECT